MSDNFTQIANQLIQHYQTTFDTNPTQLNALQRNDSCLSFETENFQGAQPIFEKLSSLGGVKHNLNQGGFASQPVMNNGNQIGILVFITGQLVIDNNQPMNFSECFSLQKDNNGWYISNQIFKLILGQ